MRRVRRASPGALRTAARVLIVFLTIVAICTHGIQPPGWSGRVAVWFLGSGIALAAVIRWGAVQYVPVYAANVFVDLLNGRSLAPAMIAEIGLPAGIFTAVWLLRRYDFHDAFEHGRDIALFAGAALIGMFIPAAVGPERSPRGTGSIRCTTPPGPWSTCFAGG